MQYRCERQLGVYQPPARLDTWLGAEDPGARLQFWADIAPITVLDSIQGRM